MNQLRWAAAVALCLVVFVCLVLAPSGTHVGSDVGYYFPMARLIGSGQWPMLDIPVHYTPLGIVMMAVPTIWTKSPSYEAMLMVQHAAIVLAALVTFMTLRRMNVHVLAALWAAAYTIFCGLYFEGSPMLEPFVTLLATVALGVAKGLTKLDSWPRWLFVGFVASLSVLAKQQGVFLVGGIAVVLAFETREPLLVRVLGFVLGGLGGVAILGLLILNAHGGPAVAIANLTWSGRQYSGQQLAAGAAVVATLFIVKSSPFLLGAPVLLRRTREWLPLLTATGIALIPALLKPYPHYLLLAVPASALIAGLMLNELVSQPSKFAPILVLLFFIALGGQSLRLALRLRGPEQNLEQLKADGAALRSVVGDRSVLQLTRPALTWFSDLTPARRDVAGYMFGGYFTRAEVRELLLPDAQFVLSEVSATGFEFNDGVLPFTDLEADGFCRQANTVAGATVWERCR